MMRPVAWQVDEQLAGAVPGLLGCQEGARRRLLLCARQVHSRRRREKKIYF